MKEFICAICGYLHEGSVPPANCPICKAPVAKFSEQSGAQAGNTSKSEKSVTSDAESGIVKVAGEEVTKVEGSIDLADKYYDEEKYEKALPIYLYLAGTGSAHAMFRIGRMYAYGQYVKKDDQNAAVWYEKAADLDYNDARYNLGLIYYQGRLGKEDYGKALACFEKCAEAGDVEAIYTVGLMYDLGQGLWEPVPSIAAQRMKKAADLGHEDAKVWIKTYCEENMQLAKEHYARKEYEEAYWPYKRAADGGNAYAMYSVGFMLRYGQGVEKDIHRAAEWLEKAVQNGNENAKKDLPDVQAEIAVEAAANKAAGEDLQLAEKYYEREEYAKAVPLYERAADRGYINALYSLGFMYLYGQGVEKNVRKAVELLAKAAESGDEVIVKKLADAHKELANEAYKRKDYAEAAILYEKAAEGGDVYAQYVFGYMLRHGQGVEINLLQALDWLRKASESGNEEAKKEHDAILLELMSPRNE